MTRPDQSNGPRDGRNARIKAFLFGEKRIYRDIWLAVITGFTVLALIASGEAVLEIQQGRRSGTEFTCAISGAVSIAGREVVEDSAKQPVPPKAEAFLRGLGYPSRPERELGAKNLGKQYIEKITERLEEKAHIPSTEAEQIINKDGTVDCQRLKVLAKVK